MHASEVTREVIERANELYWGSDRSVNQIADDLDLSKGALYGIIEPESAGVGCPRCGEEVAYANRTAKDRDMLDCPECDWAGGPDEVVPYRAGGPVGLEPSGEAPSRMAAKSSGAATGEAPSGPTGGPAEAGDETGPDDAAYGDPEAAERLPPPPFARPTATTIAGGALLGAAVGLALVMWARRR